MSNESEEKYKIIKLYPDTGKGIEFTRSLRRWCREQGIMVDELHILLMCVVKIPSLDIDYDEAYRELVERGFLTLEEHRVLIPIEEE